MIDSGWNTLCERKPNNGDWCLICVRRKGRLITVTKSQFLWFDDYFWHTFSGSYTQVRYNSAEIVEYWMKIPEPPKED